MSQLILDTSDPAVAEMVSQWEEGGTYRIELTVVQGPTKGSLVPFTVEEVTDYGDAGESAEVEEAPFEEEAGDVVGNRAQIDKVPIPGAGPKGKG